MTLSIARLARLGGAAGTHFVKVSQCGQILTAQSFGSNSIVGLSSWLSGNAEDE